MRDWFGQLGAFVTRRRRAVLIAWLVLLLPLGAIAGGAQKSLLSGGFDVPGSQTMDVEKLLGKEFHASSMSSVVVVYQDGGRTVSDAGFASGATKGDKALRALPEVESVRSYFDTGDKSLVSVNQEAAISLVALKGGVSRAQDAVPILRDHLRDPGIDAKVTGFPAIQYDTYQISQSDLKKTESITFPVVLIFLLLFFGTVVSALLPLVLGVVAIIASTGVIGLVAKGTDVSIFALNIGSMVGLGLAIDFSLFMVRRYREERARGLEVPEAVQATVRTSGRSITFSGLVLIGSMVVVYGIFHDLMIVRSIILGVLVVAVFGLLGAMTFLPALLTVLGDRIEKLRIIPRRKPVAANRGIWYRLTGSIMRRPAVWLAAAFLVLLTLTLPLLHIRMVGANTAALPSTSESVQGSDIVREQYGMNALTPINITIQTNKRDGVLTPEFLRHLRKVSNALAADPRTAQVASLSTMLSALPDDRFTSISRDFFATTPGQPNSAPAAIARRFVNLEGAADTATLMVLPKQDLYSDETLGFIRDLRTQILPGFGLNEDHVAVAGIGGAFLDFRNALYGRFLIVAIALTVLIFVLLMVFFRSIVLPIKAAVLSALVLIASNGVVVWLFQDGHGESLLGFHSQGRVNVVTPVIIFVILFGLSADYEVFMLSRVREYYLETRDTVKSVALGLQHTAGIITAAGLILVATFGSLATSNLETMKELGVGLAIGVLIDATLVRIIMVPATMRLAQKVNWWIPAWLARLLPAVAHESTATFEVDRTDGQDADDRVDITV